MNESLINYDRTWRIMVCLNPSHDLLKFKTNKIGDILCPICNFKMVVEIRPMIEELELEDLE